MAQKLDEESLAAEREILRSSNKTVRDIMSLPPITIHLDDSVAMAAELLVRHGITRLPVVDENDRLAGIVSRLDILRQVMDIPAKAPKEAPAWREGRLAKEIMEEEVPTVHEETDLAGVIASFVSSGEHRVIVIDPSGRPVGIISDSDVVGRIQPAQRKGILSALRGGRNVPDSSITARELMSVGVETISGETPIVEAVQRMLSAGRKWLVVVDDQNRPAGLIDREVALEALIR